MKIILFKENLQSIATLDIEDGSNEFQVHRKAHNECLLIKYERELGSYEVANKTLHNGVWYVKIDPEGTSRKPVTVPPPVDYINIIHLTY